MPSTPCDFAPCIRLKPSRMSTLTESPSGSMQVTRVMEVRSLYRPVRRLGGCEGAASQIAAAASHLHHRIPAQKARAAPENVEFRATGHATPAVPGSRALECTESALDATDSDRREG